jgi:hypothetical protein
MRRSEEKRYKRHCTTVFETLRVPTGTGMNGRIILAKEALNGEKMGTGDSGSVFQSLQTDEQDVIA